ncbi:MAG: DUF6151 family protein, partial [Pseudomonadota bacterium]|nr:DUF6151 family protein [Pseudomonadota bacterium]
KSGMHLVCYCDDCRAFAHALERADILDGAGGSELLVTTPSTLALTAGMDQLRCLRLSPKGMLRWYWDCCNTPLANTSPGAGLPFLSIHRAFIDVDDSALLGTPIRVQACHAKGPVPAPAERTTSLPTMLKIVAFLFSGWVRRAHQPNALFADGKPVVAPRVLSAAERDALRAVD